MRLVATAVCVIACAVLILAEARGLRRLRVVAKTTASIAFIVVGGLGGDSDVARWIVIGLVLGALGDVALLRPEKRAFLVGLGAFLLGHAAYVVACASAVPVDRWTAPFGVAPVIAAATALVWLWPHVERAMRPPVIAYVITIVAMVIGAIAVGRPRLVVGASLFFISDLAVARDKFVHTSVANRAWGLPAYYAGQLLIAWSAT